MYVPYTSEQNNVAVTALIRANCADGERDFTRALHTETTIPLRMRKNSPIE